MTTVKDDRPNILIILADDLGFTDPGCFGGEIHTPNIDKLGNAGVRFSDFQASPACAPSRSMLMTGTSAHLSGVGTLPEFTVGKFTLPEYQGQPAYRGVVSMPELLRDAGYYNVIAGKWHLGARKEHSPKARGFERSFAMLLGGDNHYAWHPDLSAEDQNYRPMIKSGNDGIYQEEGEPFDNFPDNYYSSDYFTDRLIGYLKDQKDDRPFFAYLPFTAPHFPLQVSKDYIEKYRGTYDQGPEKIRSQRIEKLRELGFISQDAKPADFLSYPKRRSNRPWEQRDKVGRERSARKMEIFAGMVERMDYNIGRVIEYLGSVKKMENTIVFFMSDNGAEGTQLEAAPANRNIMPGIRKYFDNSLDNLGAENSFCWYGNRWAQVGTAPAKLYKLFTHQGGIRVCSFVTYPKWKRQGVSHEYCTIMDVLPTILDLAKTKHPGTTYNDKEIEPMLGKSWVQYMEKKTDSIHDQDTVTGWEFIGRQALRKGNYKIVRLPPPWGTGEWEMYDLASDLAEDIDLSHKKPEKFAELLEHWKEYAEKNGIVEMKSAGRAYSLQEEDWTTGDEEEVV